MKIRLDKLKKKKKMLHPVAAMSLPCWLSQFSQEGRDKIIEIIKKSLRDNNIIAIKQQLITNLCFFMHLKWLWLLHFFAKIL